MIVSVIVAMDENHAIGKSGGLPWRLSSDLKRFRALTMGHHIIVGRRTFESIGKPLPGRETIIVTRRRGNMPEGCIAVASLEQALQTAGQKGETEVFVCGGAEIYGAALPFAERMYLTLVHARVEADTFFPEWDEREWQERESVYNPSGEKDDYPYTFRLLVRKNRPINRESNKI